MLLLVHFAGFLFHRAFALIWERFIVDLATSNPQYCRNADACDGITAEVSVLKCVVVKESRFKPIIRHNWVPQIGSRRFSGTNGLLL